MPGHFFTVSRHLAEKMRAPGNHVITKNVGDVIHQNRVRQHIVDSTMLHVSGADGIAVATSGNRFFQKLVEVLADVSDVFSGIRIQRANVAVGVIALNLFRGQSLRFYRSRVMKLQVSRNTGQRTVIRRDIKICRWRCHGRSVGNDF